MAKISVTLRQRGRASGKITLYLDIYADGERKVENLHLYLLPGNDPKTRQQNKNILAAAEAIRTRTYLEYVDGYAYINKNKKETRISEYVDQVVASKPNDVTKRYKEEFQRAKSLFIESAGKNLRLVDITADTIRAFLKTLDDADDLRHREAGYKLTSTTKYNIFTRFNHVLTRAVKDGIIPTNPAAQLDRSELPKKKSRIRQFLTLEEIQMLIDTPCKRDRMVKEAFLFCCFTGLRISDARTLTWEMVDKKLLKQQVKTGVFVEIPLTDNAIAWLPPKQDVSTNPYVFPDLSQYGASVNRVLNQWIHDAGIDKQITFHCSRHTFATLLLTYGADIFTTSKLLGHTSIRTTQIYAHILDKKKEEAVNLIPQLEFTKKP